MTCGKCSALITLNKLSDRRSFERTPGALPELGTGKLFWSSRELNRVIRELIRLISELAIWP